MQSYKYTPEAKQDIEVRPTLVVRVTPAKTKKTSHSKPDTYGRNFGLDLLRFFAIMLVLLDHGSYLFYRHIPEFIGINMSLTGNWGVQLFFVLSGFLIGRILIREAVYRPFNTKTVLNFWKRRWFRTLPNYFLFLALFTLIYFVAPASMLKNSFWHEAFELNNIKQIAYYPFFLQNFLVTDLGFMGHSWSLAVEEWFYLLLPTALFPIVYFHMKGSMKTRKVSLKGKMFGCFAGLAVFFVLVRVAGIMHVWPNYTRMSVIYNLDHLMFGVIMAWLFTYYKTSVLNKKNALLAISGVLFIAGFILQNEFLLTANPDETWNAFIIPLQAIAFTCAIPWFYGIDLRRRTGISRLIRRISIVSYSMYLVHFIILVFVIDVIQRRFDIQSGIGNLGLFLSFIIITFWVSVINYRFFEKPMTALREKVSRS